MWKGEVETYGTCFVALLVAVLAVSIVIWVGNRNANKVTEQPRNPRVSAPSAIHR